VVRVDRPLNVTYTTKRQYLVYFTSAYGQVPPQTLVDEGTTISVAPVLMDTWWPAPPVHWIFSGWQDKATGIVSRFPTAYGSTIYEAVWDLDPIPLILIGAG